MTDADRTGTDPSTDTAIATALGVSTTPAVATPATVAHAVGRPVTAPAAPDSHSTDTDDDELDDAGTDALGDAGKQALDRMKAKWHAERRARLDAEARANAASDADDAARTRREAEAAAVAKANARILRAEVRAAATGRFADPADALAFVDLTQFDVDEDGAVDADEIRAALDDVLARKPHLAAQGGKRTPMPDRSQGAGDRDAPLSTAQQFAAALRERL